MAPTSRTPSGQLPPVSPARRLEIGGSNSHLSSMIGLSPSGHLRHLCLPVLQRGDLLEQFLAPFLMIGSSPPRTPHLCPVPPARRPFVAIPGTFLDDWLQPLSDTSATLLSSSSSKATLEIFLRRSVFQESSQYFLVLIISMAHSPELNLFDF